MKSKFNSQIGGKMTKRYKVHTLGYQESTEVIVESDNYDNAAFAFMEYYELPPGTKIVVTGDEVKTYEVILSKWSYSSDTSVCAREEK